jgi:F0F1-type ATP synthase assembly protein I
MPINSYHHGYQTFKKIIMDKKYLKELFDKFEESQEKKDKAYFDYFKSISTLSVALIGLLIGLKASPIPNQASKIAFLITIILIGLCILFSLATRFYEVTAYKQGVQTRKNHILEYIENPDENNLQIDQLGKSWFYKFFEILTFSCLLLFIITLIFYVYFLEFYPSEIILN